MEDSNAILEQIRKEYKTIVDEANNQINTRFNDALSALQNLLTDQQAPNFSVVELVELNQLTIQQMAETCKTYQTCRNELMDCKLLCAQQKFRIQELQLAEPAYPAVNTPSDEQLLKELVSAQLQIKQLQSSNQQLQHQMQQSQAETSLLQQQNASLLSEQILFNIQITELNQSLQNAQLLNAENEKMISTLKNKQSKTEPNNQLPEECAHERMLEKVKNEATKGFAAVGAEFFAVNKILTEKIDSFNDAQSRMEEKILILSKMIIKQSRKPRLTLENLYNSPKSDIMEEKVDMDRITNEIKLSGLKVENTDSQMKLKVQGLQMIIKEQQEKLKAMKK
ncbi:Hypothetical_protein [Hexamita inflata]|uniref:Hypothetical_protein n=1 Tax=Hexamita inflata TaxID=28002 RepID=A0AA86TWM0_9EUKA|nr:Hypothetical protein HINF_LOCUS18766 [Hexamita inflata]